MKILILGKKVMTWMAQMRYIFGRYEPLCPSIVSPPVCCYNMNMQRGGMEQSTKFRANQVRLMAAYAMKSSIAFLASEI